MTAIASVRSVRLMAGAAGMGAAAIAGVAITRLAVERFPAEAPEALLALTLLPLLALGVVAAPVLGPIAVFATFPLGTAPVAGLPLALQPVEVAVVGVAALVALSAVAAGRLRPPWSPALWCALALAGWTLVLVPSAVDAGLAVKQLAALLAGIGLACTMLAACRDMRDLRGALLGFAGAAGVIAVAALSTRPHLRAAFGGTVVRARPTGGVFTEPNQLGALCAMAASVTAGLLYGARTAARRAATAALLVVLLAALVVSASRGAWIGAAFGVLYLVAVLPPARRAAILAGVPLVVALALAAAAGVGSSATAALAERAASITVLSPEDLRRPVYSEAWREIRAKPLTGEGPGGFRVASAAPESGIEKLHPDHAYNILLTWGAETGLVGTGLLLAFAAALAVGARRARRLARRRGDVSDHALVAGLTAALVTVAGHGLFDYTPRNQLIWYAVWGLVGALLVCRREQRRLAA